MLTISSERMNALQRARLEEVLEKIIVQLRLDYPDAPPTSELRRQMRPMLEQMSRWGIQSGGFLALHALASRVIGSDYFTLPVFESIFSDPEISEQMKEEWFGGWMASLRSSDEGKT